jgi:hypothetical protein
VPGVSSKLRLRFLVWSVNNEKLRFTTDNFLGFCALGFFPTKTSFLVWSIVIGLNLIIYNFIVFCALVAISSQCFRFLAEVE